MEFLDFGKYTSYVWASYVLTFLILIFNVVMPLLAKKKQLNKIKRQNYLNQ